MNRKHFLLLALSAILCYRCATQSKIAYNLPDTLSEQQRKELMVLVNKGRVLYKKNCSECHGIFAKGKDGIPNFTKKQMDNYSARFLMRDPKNHAAFQKMSTSQLTEVLTFLRFHKADSAVANKRG